MGSINLSNSKNRDALVQTRSVTSDLAVRWLDGKGQQVSNVRVIRTTLEHDLEALCKKVGGAEPLSLNPRDTPDLLPTRSTEQPAPFSRCQSTRR